MPWPCAAVRRGRYVLSRGPVRRRSLPTIVHRDVFTVTWLRPMRHPKTNLEKERRGLMNLRPGIDTPLVDFMLLIKLNIPFDDRETVLAALRALEEVAREKMDIHR